MSDATKAISEEMTKGARREASIGAVVEQIVTEVERTKCGDIAKELFDGHRKADIVFPDSSTFSAQLRLAVKAGYKALGKAYPRARTKGYFDLDNVLRSITRHYAELAVKAGIWAGKGDDEADKAWDIDAAVERLVKAHKPDELKAYIAALQKALASVKA